MGFLHVEGWRSRLLVLLATSGVSVEVSGEVVAGWHFNGVEAPGGTLVANHGAGLLDLAPLGGSVGLYAGTTENALPGDVAGLSLGFRGSGGNGTWFELVLEGAPAPFHEIAFAWRNTATGHDENTVELFTGRGWATLGGFGSGSDGGVGGGGEWKRIALPFAGGFGETRLRFRLDGAEGANGVLRIDNLRVVEVPAPGACLLGLVGGVLGLLTGRRRA